MIKDELTIVFLKLFSNMKLERILPNSSYEAIITLISKLDKDTARKLQTSISDEYRSKNSQ